MSAAFRASACPPWTRITTSPRRMLSLRDGSRDGHRVRVTRPSTFSSRRSRTPRWRCLSASGSTRPLPTFTTSFCAAWFSATAPSAPARIRSPAVAPGARRSFADRQSDPGLATSTSPSQGEVDQHGTSQRDLEVRGLRLARPVVEQEEEQVLCDQRHRADGTTRD